jgi:hypothetical protein
MLQFPYPNPHECRFPPPRRRRTVRRRVRLPRPVLTRVRAAQCCVRRYARGEVLSLLSEIQADDPQGGSDSLNLRASSGPQTPPFPCNVLAFSV